MNTLISILAIIGAMTVLFLIGAIVLYLCGCDVAVKDGAEYYSEEKDYES